MEVADGEIGPALAQEARQEHQVVVVDPNPIACLRMRGDGSCKRVIDLAIRLPVAAIEAGICLKVVK